MVMSDIVQLTGAEELPAIAALRAKVWGGQDEYPVKLKTAQDWTHEVDFRSHHWVVRNADSTICASARLSIHEHLIDVPEDVGRYLEPFELNYGSPFGLIARLVIDPGSRGKGLAKKLDQIRLREAKKLGAKWVLALPVHYRVKALQAIGFVHLGVSPISFDAMDDIDIETHVMVHTLEGV